MIMENKWIKSNLRHKQLNIKCVYSEVGKTEKWKLVINEEGLPDLIYKHEVDYSFILL